MTFDAFGFWRESWTVPLRDAHPALRDAVRAFAAAHGLALEDLPALETKTTRKPGFFERWRGADTTSRSVAVVAPGLLVWAVLGEGKTAATALAAKLATVTVEPGMGGRIGAIMPSARSVRGLSVTGVFEGGSGQSATAFLGYGKEADGDHFEQRLRAAMRDAGNPLHGLG
jgi:hypothetical protein